MNKLRFSDQKSNKNDIPDKKSKPKEDNKKEETAKRLSDLLSSMPTESDLNKMENISLPLAKPRNKSKQKIEEPHNIFKAVKEVASTLGGDPKQTEIDLLAKLLNSTGIPHKDSNITNDSENYKENQLGNLSLR